VTPLRLASASLKGDFEPRPLIDDTRPCTNCNNDATITIPLGTERQLVWQAAVAPSSLSAIGTIIPFDSRFGTYDAQAILAWSFGNQLAPASAYKLQDRRIQVGSFAFKFLVRLRR
jgi:hypothetical protein